MLFKLLIMAAIVYWLYKKIVCPSLPDTSRRSANLDEDIMVQDPACHTYVPRQQAIHLRIDEQDFYFCSTSCRDKFLSGYTKKQTLEE